MSLNIGLFQDSGNVLNGVIVSNNYLDPTGTFTPTGFGDLASEVQGSNLTIENNVNLLTGQATAPTAGSFATGDVKSVVPSVATGTEVVGNSITFTVNLDQPMTVTGTPTLTLNDGGVATYTGGSGTQALTFSYTVGANDSAVSALAITQVNLPGGATVTNLLGDAANLSGALKSFAGLQVNPVGSTGSTPSAPTIVSFSTDSGVAGDHITNDSTLTLTGSAVANSTVTVFDGSSQVGTATANASGAWSLTTTALADGSHSLTAKAANTGGTSSASVPLSVTIDTVAPSAPTIVASTSAATLASTHVEVLTGAAEANSTIAVFDGTTKLGTATANSSGAWSYTTAALSTGSHSFTAAATDAAGNTGATSTAAAVTIAAAPAAPTIASFSSDSGVVGDHITNDSTLTLTGSAVANSTVKVFDGTTQIATATANSSGAWSSTATALADGSHNLTATATNAVRDQRCLRGACRDDRHRRAECAG